MDQEEFYVGLIEYNSSGIRIRYPNIRRLKEQIMGKKISIKSVNQHLAFAKGYDAALLGEEWDSEKSHDWKDGWDAGHADNMFSDGQAAFYQNKERKPPIGENEFNKDMWLQGYDYFSQRSTR